MSTKPEFLSAAEATSSTLSVTINGELRQVESGSTLETLVVAFGLDPSRVAVERNRQIVRRPLWAQTPVAAGDQLEFVHFVGGG